MFDFFARKLKTIRWGDQAFVEPSLPYRGEDSVLRLSPASPHIMSFDIAGAGAVCGYAAAQGAPSEMPHMIQGIDIAGAGVISGFGRQPGQLLDMATLSRNKVVGG